MNTFQGEQKEVPITAEHGLDRTAQSTVGEAQVRSTMPSCSQSRSITIVVASADVQRLGRNGGS
jgi:hypothetical protein